MRLVLSLPVLVLTLMVALEGSAPAQAAPDFSTLERIPDKLKEFGNTLEDKARKALEKIKQSEITTKTRNWFSEAFSKMKEKFKSTFS
ncbi:apolipoprotein C-I [Ochotona curzoniae]|uniref:apolipoprotein C-I n=1 Tax=Ochotona curzoniae TaxID=130825 RepID=UPI001B351AD3|nr:apolipoprotein C-I [Ochotona curzoniae]